MYDWLDENQHLRSFELRHADIPCNVGQISYYCSPPIPGRTFYSPRHRWKRRFILFSDSMKLAKYIFVLIILLTLLACGGGGVVGAKSGKVSISITWPTPSRVIPVAASSIGIIIKNSEGLTVVSTFIAKPTTLWMSSDLPVESYTLTATAYPNLDATGVAQATGVTNFAPLESQTIPVSISMGSTVTSVSLSATTQSLTVGEAVQVTATCKDAQGNLVLVHHSTLNWLSSQPSTASTNLDGLVTGVSAGSSNISATFTEVDSSLGQGPVTSPVLPIAVASPSRIFFTAQSDSSLGGGIYSILPDGTGQTKHLALAVGQWNCFAVSLDSKTLYAQTTSPPYDYSVTDLASGTSLGTLAIPGTVRGQSPWLDATHLITSDNAVPGFTIYDTANNTSSGQVGSPSNWGTAAIDSTHFAHGTLDGTGVGANLYIRDTTTGSETKINYGFIADIWPLSYDPTSNFLYCQFGSGGVNDWKIVRVHPDGTGFQTLTSGLSGISYAPTVSPDGTKVAFINSSTSSWWTNGTYALYTMNADGTGKQKILEGTNLFGTGFTQHSPLYWAK